MKIDSFALVSIQVMMMLSMLREESRSDYHNVFLGLTTRGICDVIVWMWWRIKRWNFMQKNFSVKELLESTRKPSSAVKHNFELMTTDALLQITFIFDYHFKIRIKK